MGHRKSSAALLIVCERIFLLLGADHSSADQVRTKDDELLKRVLNTQSSPGQVSQKSRGIFVWKLPVKSCYNEIHEITGYFSNQNEIKLLCFVLFIDY